MRDATAFSAGNPMLAKDRSNGSGVEMQSNPGSEGSAAGRESDLVAAGERPSPSANPSTVEEQCVL